MAMHWMTTAQSAERGSVMFITRRAVDQPMNTRGSFPWSNVAGA